MKWLSVYVAVYLTVAREVFRNSKLGRDLSDRLEPVLSRVRRTSRDSDAVHEDSAAGK